MRSPLVRIDHDLDRSGLEAVRGGQRLAHHAGLRQRQRAAARADPQECAGGLRHADLAGC